MSLTERKSALRDTDLIIYMHQQTKGYTAASPEVKNVDIYYIVEQVREKVSSDYAEELAQHLGSPDYRARMEMLIVRIINELQLATDVDVMRLAEMIYHAMAGLGVLEAYLADPNVEEIVVNGPDRGDIWVYKEDGKQQAPDSFPSPSEVRDIAMKAARFGGVVVDQTKPYGDSYLIGGTRVFVAIDPVVDKAMGAVVSIRKQRPSRVTRDNIIRWGTATEEQLELLSTFINNGISVAFAGSTSSGKTAALALLLQTVPHRKRIVTIEDTRELMLKVRNADGVVANDVVHMLTKEPPHAVSLQQSVINSLRQNAEILVPSEMRGAEALTVQEAGRTGHTIVTTLHANSARDAYDRILTMCLQGDTTLSEERLLALIVQAFPIMVHCRQLSDGSRKYMEIFEARGVSYGSVQGNTIYKFVVTGHDKDEQDEVTKVHGRHLLIGKPSEEICQHLFDEGVELDFIRKYHAGFSPHSTGGGSISSERGEWAHGNY